ncbi:hypothetical protein [Microvirga lotononidis]|uniref:Uncharacterized protein n=1 Tax=Microvirga lotononidis TaxID=864069 RepID=I4YRC8_9HYPH|nr:hypothetical protein [Microvirga lotononidis]EIM26520.1 hypothetical protein MicloDRAFT_00030690 [Microvirga lotononidis]WQO31204.1 hypothetical protein U0023_33430 [Microvirga lotononidis]
MNRIALVLLGALVTTGALAQVPTNDAARLKEEDKTARCMLRSRTYKANTVKPTEGVKESVAAPKSGGGSMNAGTSYVIGPGQASSVVNGIDVAALVGGTLGVINAVQGKNYAAMAQSIGALAAVIQANMQGLNQGKAQIGGVQSLQGAWDQNSQARIGTVGVWGQAIQAGSIRLQYENDKLLRQIEEASSRQKMLTYDRAKARLVEDSPSTGQ